MTLANAPTASERDERSAGFPEVHGEVSRGFEPVREAFDENFARRQELGGACCAYHHSKKVADLWGGIRDKRTGEPWEMRNSS
jgi:hypothetical protein